MRTRVSTGILPLIAMTILAFGCSKEDPLTEPVTDIDGNTYKTVRIGTQVWMAENLRTTRLNDGVEITLTENESSWLKNTGPGYCWYDNEETAYKDIYGALYNGISVNTGKLCPDGWHVPAKEDFQILIEFSGDSLSAGGKMKESGTRHWLAPNKGADNSTGFSALPGGVRYFEGTFSSLLQFTGFWSETETETEGNWFLSLYYGDAKTKMDHKSKKYGLSVRCVQN